MHGATDNVSRLIVGLKELLLLVGSLGMNVMVTEWFVVKSLGAGSPASTALGSVYKDWISF